MFCSIIFLFFVVMIISDFLENDKIMDCFFIEIFIIIFFFIMKNIFIVGIFDKDIRF